METMLRRLSLLLALLIALAGCAAAEEVPNPRVEMADASELEAALGFPVNAPEGVDAVYTVIGGSTGEAAFDVGDIACTLRAARTQDDISGLFMEMSEPHRGRARRRGGRRLRRLPLDGGKRRL